MSKSAKKFAVGAVLVAAAGYVAGLLTAPKSGKETREDIKEVTHKGLIEAEKQLKSLHTEMSELLHEAQDKTEILKGKSQKELEEAIKMTKVAKEKAREFLSALHEDGGAEDKDLRKAIDEANKAVEHLKKYLKK